MSTFSLYPEFGGKVEKNDLKGHWKQAYACLKWGCLYVYSGGDRMMYKKPEIVPLFTCSMKSFRFRSMVMEIRRPGIGRNIRLKLRTEREVSEWNNALKKYCAEWDILSRFQKIKELGHGAFGTVHHVLDTEAGQKLAMKVINTKETSNANELEIMSKIDHPNLLVAHGISLE